MVVKALQRSSPTISWQSLFLPCSLFFVPASVPLCAPLGHVWMPAQENNFALFGLKLSCTQEALLKDFTVHCMGQIYHWNTARIQGASLRKYDLFQRLNVERPKLTNT